MSLPRIDHTDDRLGFRWVTAAGEPTSLPDLVLVDGEPARLPPTHLEALDDVLIDAAGRFGELLGGGRPPDVGQERADLHELQEVLDRLNLEYADAADRIGLPIPARGGQIVGTSALFAIRARMALGRTGPFPFAGALSDPGVGVVSGHGQLQWVDADQPWRGARWVVAGTDGRRYPLTLSMLLFDSSGVDRDAAVDEHRAALTTLVEAAADPVDPFVLAGSLDWLLGDWLMANRESPDSAAIELRSGRLDDAALIVRAAAANARLRHAEPALMTVPTSLVGGRDGH